MLVDREDGKKGDEKATEESSPQEDLEKEEGTSTATADEEKTSTETESESSTDGEKTSQTEEEKEREKWIPRHRFDEVQGEVKQLRAELSQLRQETSSKSKEKTWDDVPLEQLEFLQDKYLEEGNTKMARFVQGKIVERRVDERTDKKLGAMDFNRVRTETWKMEVDKMKDLNDPAFDLSNDKSELYQRTLKIVQSDPRFDKMAEGHAVAARLAASDMLHERLKKSQTSSKSLEKKVKKAGVKESLESSGRAASTTTDSAKLEKLLDAAEKSGNPYGPEWKAYLKAVDDGEAKKRKG